jgi:predicted amidophosphoribosyltransferase
VLLASTCAVCGRRGGSPCPACLEALRPAPALPPPSGVDACWALLAYEGAGRELVARLKYRNHRAALGGLARAAASLVAAPVDVVTWPPTGRDRRRARGYDQAELLARAVARHLGVRARRSLTRAPGPPQTGRGLAGRRRGPAFSASRPLGGRVLVVDDVVTSGATVSAAARALRGAGAARVVVLALARTPLRT